MLTSLFILTTLICFQTGSPAPLPDATVIIHQNTLNGFFNAIGPISGKDQYNVLGMHGEYTWTLRNARIELRPSQARFIADADIHVGPLSYGSEASGNVEVLFHPERKSISQTSAPRGSISRNSNSQVRNRCKRVSTSRFRTGARRRFLSSRSLKTLSSNRNESS